jgi:hypothetical protein
MSKFIPLAAAVSLVSAGAAFADPVKLTMTQLDKVVAGAQPTSDGFVCPVIKTDAVLNSPKGAAIAGGHYTIAGPNVSVPTHATNQDGAGSPGGAHAAPGDTGYSAIWSRTP